MINITTGGGHGMTVEERTLAARTFKPEMCSLNMGSMNFGLFRRARPHQGVQARLGADVPRGEPRLHLPQHLQGHRARSSRQLGANGTRFEFECYDVGHLYNLAHFLERGLVKPPLFVQTIFGILGGIGSDTEDLLHMRRTADRLFGDDYQWSILGAGRHQTNLVTMGAIMGGNVRVGLEDSIYLEKGRLAESNGEQVAKIARILKELSLEVATPDEARALLALKGRENTAIGG